ncbi:MAG: molybdate ABC transporter substrate-binding protein [Desulfofustis sp.]|jgi:molybdate transport system substrate-binding protein|nr:molybdate ABC transporter substrate-binding protein [Desulfofustis sp.]
MLIKQLFWAVLLTAAWSAPASAATLYLSVAASMTDAFTDIIASFAKSYPDVRVLPNFASSGALAKQIAQGAPADLYVSANTKWMQYLMDNNLVDESTNRVLARNTLVFVGDPRLNISALDEIGSLDRIGLGTPQSVPAGQYARQAMEAAGIYEPLAAQRKLVFAKDVRQALIHADRGEVDGSFVYRTDALLARNAKILFTVPAALHDPVCYPVALTASGSGKTEAIAFQAFLASDQARDILQEHGFEPAQ